jgi:hypothetical protein
MTKNQVRALLDKYRGIIVGDGENRDLFPSKADGDGFPECEDDLNHCLWMLGEIRGMLDQEPGEEAPRKAERWLCFIQGVFWVNGYRTINEMREDNRGAPNAD